MFRVISTVCVLPLTLAACDIDTLDEKSDGIIIEQEIGDGPFGTYMGMPKSEFAKLTELDFNYYKTLSVPRTSTAFEFHEASFDEQGLCMLQALGIDIETDAAGGDLKFQFDRVSEALEKKYGPEEEFIDEDSSEPEKGKPISYMQRLMDGTQLREKYWWSSDENDFPGNVNSISLRTKALSEEVGYLVVRYEFDNYSACEAMDKATELDNL